ncbi:MAG: hypothetical protein H6R45_809 [Proteobacteria bacterium]|nr:hypothetical protein [Pseudomonadota bacterium]
MLHWYRVKLELAPNDQFPKGSPGRAYLLRLPLTPAGRIDQAKLAASPEAAMVRRFWPNEPDRSGVIRRNSAGVELIFPECGIDHPAHLEDAPVVSGGTLQMTDPDGSRMAFRVVSIRSD